MMGYEWFHGDEDLADIWQIRTKVFIEEQNVPIQRERIVAEDTAATHLLVLLKDAPVATGRILAVDGKFILGRIAVLREYRGRGLGKLVTELLAQKCFEMGADEVVLSSQYHAKGFYEELGFDVCSEVYMDAGIEHVSMVLKKTCG